MHSFEYFERYQEFRRSFFLPGSFNFISFSQSSTSIKWCATWTVNRNFYCYLRAGVSLSYNPLHRELTLAKRQDIRSCHIPGNPSPPTRRTTPRRDGYLLVEVVLYHIFHVGQSGINDWTVSSRPGCFTCLEEWSSVQGFSVHILLASIRTPVSTWNEKCSLDWRWWELQHQPFLEIT